MPGEIYIDDLARPILSELQKSALAYGESLTVSFNREGILQEAKTRTGLSDFGTMDFVSRLDLLCEEWGGDRGLTGIGRLSLRNKLVLFASTRLLVEQKINAHPQILDEKIHAPIIVAGLPRSGTTHLLNLMAADSRLRSLPLWESYEPIALPSEVGEETAAVASGLPGQSPRYQRCAQNWEMMQAMTPHLAAMHPMSPDHIHEELELMGPDFASYNFEWLAVSPKWRDHYYSSDQIPHYEYLKKILQLLQWQDKQAGIGRERWVLKCPQHMEQLDVLKKVFPDATVAITHRDPVAVITSTVTMLAYGQRIGRQTVETSDLIHYWSERIEYLLRSCVRERSVWSSAQSLDVPFDVFMQDDLAMVEKIYSLAALPMTTQVRSQLQSHLNENPRGKHGKMVYNLSEQFGVQPQQLRERYAFYFDRFAVKAETN